VCSLLPMTRTFLATKMCFTCAAVLCTTDSSVTQQTLGILLNCTVNCATSSMHCFCKNPLLVVRCYDFPRQGIHVFLAAYFLVHLPMHRISQRKFCTYLDKTLQRGVTWVWEELMSFRVRRLQGYA